MKTTDSWESFVDYRTHRSVADVVAKQQNLVLGVKDGASLKRLYFQDGRLVFASSNHPEECLSATLARRGVLSLEQYSQAKGHFSPNTSIARNLLDLGLVSEGELRDTARAQVFGILTGVVRVKQGQISVSAALPEESIVQIPMVMPQDLIRALLEWEDRSWIGARFQDRFAKQMQICLTPSVMQWVKEVDPVGGQICGEITQSITLNELVYERDFEPFFILRWVYIVDLLNSVFRNGEGADGNARSEQPPVRREILSRHDEG